MTKLGIFGTSGFAREVGDIAEALGYDPIYLAADAVELAAWQFDAPAILESELASLGTIPFAVGIGENRVRERVAMRHRDRLTFPSLAHPSATFGAGQRAKVEAQRGVIVCAGVRFTNNIQVGQFSIFNLNATVGHDCRIDDFVNVSPGANISGNVHVGARAWIGTGAAINQGSNADKLRIGQDTVIGSGSVVVRSCDEQAVYVGIPAKRIK
ncbi:MAG TPA: NeuD/PglB/VioB family sugar acetyltransferase [Burkholderiaceae bacterium]